MSKLYLICCAGSGERWKNYRGVPKHLLRIDGVPLLQRTVMNIQERDDDAEIVVLSPEDHRYNVHGTTQHFPVSSALPNTGLGHSYELWHAELPTVVLFGDVYYSKTAFDVVTQRLPATVAPLWFGRAGPGKSGCPWGELFGVALLPGSAPIMRATFNAVALAHATKAAKRGGGWECYRHLHKIPLNSHAVTEHFVEINDETEDFDLPEDYDKWMRAFRGA